MWWLLACAPLPSTLLVAPAPDGEWDDPGAIEKAGPAAFTSIQDAIDAASSGDTVAVPSGTWFEDLDLKDGVTLDGAGQGQTILVGSITIGTTMSASVSGLTLYDALWYSGDTPKYNLVAIGVDEGSSLSLSDVGVWYFGYGLFAQGTVELTIDGCTFSNNNWGMWLEFSEGLLVTNSLFTGNGQSGIEALDATRGEILHSVFVNNGHIPREGSDDRAGVDLEDGSTEVMVANNVMVNNEHGLR